MTPEEVEARFQRIEALLAQTAASQAKTEAIANSNARAILANTEANRATDAKLDRLTDVVQATDAKLDRLTDVVQATEIKLDRLADLVERYIIATQIRQDASEIRVEGLENRVSDLENQ
jgi:polyhydroxyalkanoate synthesis regulator phasin